MREGLNMVVAGPFDRKPVNNFLEAGFPTNLHGMFKTFKEPSPIQVLILS